jgi:hypothetical protein
VRARHRRVDALRGVRLQDVVHGLHLERADGVFVEGGDEHGERHRLGPNRPHHVEPASLGHLDVEEDHVRGKRADGVHGARPRMCLAHHLDLGEVGEHASELASGRLLVVDYKDPHHRAW